MLLSDSYIHLAPGPCLSQKDKACRVYLYQKWNDTRSRGYWR